MLTVSNGGAAQKIPTRAKINLRGREWVRSYSSVLAYHLMAAILRELKRKGINHRRETIKEQMATQVQVTTSMTTKKGERVYIRQTTEPEPFHYEIHRALGILPKPLRTKRLRV